jgi:uncharacterized protein
MKVRFAVVLLLAGCASSAPLRFYTLSEIAPANAGAAPAGAPSAIRVARVRIPAELDRTELVQRIDANQLRIGELDRWAAPLDDMIRRVLSADFQARTGAATAGQAPATLSVDIEELMGDATCAVTLTASWELKGAGAAPSQPANNAPTPDAAASATTSRSATGREIIRIPAPSSAACSASALPMPMSQALAQLSERILAAAR